ncbi:hypothetical protein M0813_15878 [Anaeramoeba flamelloides]|uniref:Rap-GAP domain-containing protein n=1 Tax=Anaeramoeba flamelloides TaxID=1746091 RepID=A0ABQ8Z2F5_9EUKA|nr:hypothetical protein M0813_15878 [Anaeramoeba flamelloides]
MFLQHISQVTPNQQRSKTNVLVSFPLTLKKSYISQLLDYINKCTKVDQLITSTFHLKWFLEITGQAFSLPIEEHLIISQAIQLYHSWVIGDNLPDVFDNKRDYFLKEIFGHLSLLFKPRENLSKELSSKHTELCKDVISIFNRFGTKEKDYISGETWCYLLNILMGITDSLIRNEGTVTEPILSEIFPVHMLKLLFELWLISETQDLKSWQLLKNLARDWVNRKETIIQWSSTIFGLLNRVISILYGSFEGTESVAIALPSPPDTTFHPSFINISDEKVIFSWEKILNILGNPNDFKSPELFHLAMSGLKDIVTLLLGVGNKQEYKKTNKRFLLSDQPSGNSILKIFGQWPIEAVFLNRTGFEEGTSVAYSILCKIFTAYQSQPIHDEYLYKFYSFIVYSFENEQEFSEASCSIIMNTETIFLTKLRGLFILIPYYLKIINKILLKPKPTFKITVPLSTMRRSALLILKTLVCLPNHFPDLKIPQIVGYTNDNVSDFHFISTLRYTVIKGFPHETDPTNAKIFFWLMGYLIFATIKKQSTVVPLIILTIQKYLCAPTPVQESWPIDVILASFDLLRTITPLVDQINECSTQTLPNLLIGLSRVLKKYLDQPPPNWNKKDLENVIIGLFDLISDLVCIGQWVFYYPNTFQEILQGIVKILILTENPKNKTNSKKKRKQTKKERKKTDEKLALSKKVKLKAQQTWKVILRVAGNFPLSTGPANFSTLLTEEIIMKQSGLNDDEFNEYIKVFLFNDETILSIIEYPFKDNKDQKFSELNEKINLCSTNLSSKKKLKKVNNSNILLEPSFFFPIDVVNKTNCINQMINIQDRIEKNAKNLKEIETKINNLETNQRILEQNHRNEKVKRGKGKEKKDVQKQKKNEKEKELEKEVEQEQEQEQGQEQEQETKINNNNRLDKKYKFNDSRLLLTNLSFLGISEKKSFVTLKHNEEFFLTLRKLDNCNERICHSIGVVYLAPNQNRYSNMDEIYENECGDENYEDFLRQIGWIVDLKTHTGFKGGLDWKTTGRYTPYFADYKCEIVFKVSTLLKMQDLEKKKKIIGECSIVIIWCNDERIFNPKCIKSKNNQIFFIIRPHHTGLFTITIQDFTSNFKYSGPLMDKSLLDKEILIYLLRSTILNYNYKLNINKLKFIEPNNYRHIVIKGIKRKFLVKYNNQVFLKTFFSNYSLDFSSSTFLDLSMSLQEDESPKSEKSDFIEKLESNYNSGNKTKKKKKKKNKKSNLEKNGYHNNKNSKTKTHNNDDDDDDDESNKKNKSTKKKNKLQKIYSLTPKKKSNFKNKLYFNKQSSGYKSDNESDSFIIKNKKNTLGVDQKKRKHGRSKTTEKITTRIQKKKSSKK